MGDAEDILLAAVHVRKQKGRIQGVQHGAEGDVCLGGRGSSVNHLMGQQIGKALSHLFIHLCVQLFKALQRLLPVSLRGRRRLFEQIDIPRLCAVFCAVIKVLQIGAIDWRQRLLELLAEAADLLPGVANAQHLQICHPGIAFISQRLCHLTAQLHQLHEQLSHLCAIPLDKRFIVRLLSLRLQIGVEHLPLRCLHCCLRIGVVILRFQLLLLFLQGQDFLRTCLCAHLTKAGGFDLFKQLVIGVLDAGIPSVEVLHLLAVKAVVDICIVAHLRNRHAAVKLLGRAADFAQGSNQPKRQKILLCLLLRLYNQFQHRFSVGSPVFHLVKLLVGRL